MKSTRNLVILVIVMALVSLLTACGGGSTSKTTGETAVAMPDTSLTDQSVLGNWQGIVSSNRIVKITKTDSGYLYADNEGSYPSTFKDGVLSVQVGPGDAAQAYYDAKAKHLVVIYQEVTDLYVKQK